MKFFGTLIAIGLLAGCGGGGGGPVAGAGVATATTTSGYAAKGTIKNAKVYVCRIKSGAVEADAQCATGTTGTDGAYKVSLTDGWSGPVMVKVMPVSGSKMLNEITGLDEEFNLTEGIRAVVATAETPAHVTPFSDMAANAAVTAGANGSLNATLVQQANAMVQSNFGVDLSIKPLVDLKGSSTDPSALGKQIAMVQKLAQVVHASKHGTFKNTAGANCTTVACGMEAMRAMATSTTSVKKSDGSTFTTVFAESVTINFPMLKDDGTIAVVSMDPKNTTDMQNKLAGAGLKNAVSMSTSMRASLDQENSNTASNLADLNRKTADSNGKVIYVPPSTTELASLAQAKVMVNFLREALNRFSNATKTGSLDKQQVRIEAELKDSVAPSVDRTFNRLNAIQMGLQLYDDASAPGASGLQLQTSNGKYYYYRKSGTVGDALYGGNYTYCSAEKASTGNSISQINCSTVAKDTFKSLPASGTFNGISSNSSSKMELAGVIGVASFRLFPSSNQDGAFTYVLGKQIVAVVRDTSNNFDWSNYYRIPEQNINLIGGPYNFDTATLKNTLDPSCVSSTASTAYTGYVSTTWNDTTGSKCAAFLGTGKITRTMNSGSMASLTITGTMPPSEISNTRQIGYDNVALTFSSTDIDTFTTNNTLSGSVEGYQMAKSASSVEVDTSKVFKIALDSGSYIKVKKTLGAGNQVISTNALEGTLKLSFTAINTKGVGVLTANDWVVDKNGREDAPKTIVFDGTLSDISSGGAGDILKGKLTITRPKYGQIDSSKPAAFGNDDGATVSFVGSVNAKQSSDYIKASLAWTSIFSADAKPEDSISIKLEIAGGFVLEGSARGNSTPGSSAIMKLKNQDGIILKQQSEDNLRIYASDEKTELGKYVGKAGVVGSAFYFIDGSVVSLY